MDKKLVERLEKFDGKEKEIWKRRRRNLKGKRKGNLVEKEKKFDGKGKEGREEIL